ncbi:MAG TPA: hypothetical protein PLS95_15425, partial [Thermoanaerobaculales bacterium]|nr:hypothetical protein [Thermoanaerobaculales bacterium]
MRKSVLGLALCCVLSGVSGWAAEEGTRLLRFPDIWGDQVVFCHGGDLWLAPAAGGTARRLTAHPGQELFPRFSPDGQWIAFTGQYDGDEQVYVVPATGGEPTRLTWYPAEGPLPPRWGYDNQVYGWTRDGERVLFRSLRDAGGGSDTRLYTVARTGGLPEPLPMPSSGAGDFSPDGKQVVYSPLFRDFRHWKRYEGGWAQDLYVFDLATRGVRGIAHSVRTERDPMWIGDTIYFASDRDDYLNLYAADPATGTVEQLTRYSGVDVRWPSTDNESRIVYELAGQLHIYDVAKRADQSIVVTVPDDGLWKRPRHLAVGDAVEDFDVAPHGERAVFVARGEVFSVPISKGPVRNLSRTSGAHERAAVWSPDGTTIAFISDSSGEDEIWLVDQAGAAPARRLTSGHEARLSGPVWSPDSARIAFSDKDGKLFVTTVADGREVQVADHIWGAIFDYAWSPDGGHLAFSLGNPAQVSQLHIWSVADAKLRTITSELFEATTPAWSPDGSYLFFLSNRSYAPLISDLEWNYAGDRRGGIYGLALRKDVKPLLPPESDEVKLEEDKGDETAAKQEDGKDGTKKGKDGDKVTVKAAKKPVVIDFDGLADRVIRIPVSADNYAGLVAVEGHLLFGSAGPNFYGRPNDDTRRLQAYSLEKREPFDLVKSKLDAWAVSADGTKVLVQQGEKYQLLEVKKDGGEAKTVATSGLEMDLVPAEEWAEIFDETWRRFRDFFYVPNMHGYDWKAIGDRYRALLPDVAHRSDLNYVLTEMVSELNSGHTYISGGDFQIPERAPVGLPGARFELDAKAGRYRIASI